MSDVHRQLIEYEEEVIAYDLDLFRSVQLHAFEYTCLECDYLGIPKRGDEFQALLLTNRLEVMVNIFGCVQKARKDNKTLTFTPATQKEMLYCIKQYYSKPESKRSKKNGKK